ncbi:MAG TPA: hypothetical protein VKB75_13820 [Jatrophihabitans sp.]|nr:hypothetical protein [Jatrophihabitans sp.]
MSRNTSTQSLPRGAATSESSVGGRRSGPARRGPRHAGREGARRMPFIVLVTALIVGGMALLLLLNTASAANEVRRHHFNAQDQTVAAMVQDVQNQVAASAAPGNLARAAAALGMVPAGAPAFLVIASNGTVQVLGSPGPVTEPPLPAPPASHSPTNSASKTKSDAKSDAKSPTNSTSKTTGKSTSPGNGGHVSSTAAKHSASHPAPPPSPTPTPTLTLPGGHR